MSLRRRLPPLSALVTFEAAARLLSFTQAAAELNVTQAAVSRQIHLLEQELGAQLFIRVHRGVKLTGEGSDLLGATGAGFGLMLDSIGRISRKTTENDLVVSATVAISHFWLMPRISEFSRLHPEINMRIIAHDDENGLAKSEVDVFLRYGQGTWPDGDSSFLFRDHLFPVCSAAYARSHPAITSLPDLVTHPLISHRHTNSTWTSWSDWLAKVGATSRYKAGIACSSYLDAVYACLAGQGIVLGWRRMISDFMDRGDLVRLTDLSLQSDEAYYVVVSKAHAKKRATAAFAAWLSTWRDPSETASPPR